MATDKIRVTKITTVGGDVHYTRELDRSKLRMPGIARMEDAEMTEDEFNAIPATEVSRRFFAGDNIAGRSE